MIPRPLSRDSPWLLALLAALVALGPLSVDMYLPAMPRMMVALDTDVSYMHLTLSTYLTGFALFHLVCGPLADRIGRKPVLIGGTLLFVGACLGCALSGSVEELLVYRFIQGVGACVGPTLARTIARDVFGPTRAARALSLIAMLMALAPAVAPTLGSVVLLWLPWPVIFIFLALYGTVMITLIQLFLEETLPFSQSLRPAAIARNFAELLRNRLYLTATIGSGMIYAGLLMYLSSSSFVYIEMLGVPIAWFGPIFLTSVAGYMLGSALSARLTRHYVPEQIVLMGAGLVAGASAAMLVGGTLLPRSVLALALPIVFYASGMGLVLPNAMAVALRPFPHIAGTASALLGFIQMALSASATAVVGAYLRDTPAPLLYLMCGVSLAGLGLSALLHRYRDLVNYDPAERGPE
ncbi:MAG: multidrug effflux MFS transporter [Halioglobus sp.]|nr:multidrug effflux MFS transporter [Halioglobus sp.]